MGSKKTFFGFSSALLLGCALLVYFHFPAVRAQNSSDQTVSSPSTSEHMPMPPAMPQSIYAGLWRVDHSFVSTIHIKNLMTANSVQVTPVLYIADGTEYDLSPVNLGPNAVADVSVNQALAQAPPPIAAHRSTYGRAELKYIYPAPGTVAGDITMVDNPRSLIFTSGFEMMMAMMGPNSPAFKPSKAYGGSMTRPSGVSWV
jgi:hypothetical protein